MLCYLCFFSLSFNGSFFKGGKSMLKQLTESALQGLKDRLLTVEGKNEATKELKELQLLARGVPKNTLEYYELRNKILNSDLVASFIYAYALSETVKVGVNVLEIYNHIATNIMKDIDNFDFEKDVLITTYLFEAIKGYAHEYGYMFCSELQYGRYAQYCDEKYACNKKNFTPHQEEKASKNEVYEQERDPYYADRKQNSCEKLVLKKTLEALLEDFSDKEKVLLNNFIEGSKPRDLANAYNIPVQQIYRIIKSFRAKAKGSKVLNDFIDYYYR